MGRECVIQLADRFAGLEEIWVIARRGRRLDKLAGKVPVPLRVLELDLQEELVFAELEEKLEWEDPEVKILVNGAGFGKIGCTEDLQLDEETGMIDVNCRALTAVTRLVLPYMSKNSRILQFASAAAFLPQPRFAVYAATKAFVLSYSRALAMELKPRQICVTAVCPGPVKTEFFDIAETTGEHSALQARGHGRSQKGSEKGTARQHDGKNRVCIWVSHESLLPAGKDITA